LSHRDILFNAKPYKIMKKHYFLQQAAPNLCCSRKILNIMRITVFLLFVSVFQIYAAGSYSQNTRLDLDMGETTVAQVLQEIEKQSEFYFLFNQKLVDVDRKVNMNVKNRKIHDILSQVFDKTGIDYVVMNKQIVLSPGEYLKEIKELQPLTVTGKVTSAASGEPLPGVNIRVKGTTVGTTTDVDGNYSIEAPSDATLMFSFVGYQEKTIPVRGRNTINVKLKEVVTEMEEVVVVGYGTQERGNITSSISSVSTEDIAEMSPESVDQILQGQASGVDVTQTSGLPGAGSQIRIRGVGTIGNTQPLVVIDGQPTRMWGEEQFNPLAMLNPQDIESIQVLKSASATAIYGARAANGVILIQTKKGSREKTTFSFNATAGFAQPWKKLDLLNAKQYIAFAKDIQEEAPTDVPSKLNTDYVLKDRTDWQDEVFRNGLQMDYNFNMDGGGENSMYHIGLGYMNKSGHVIGHNFERFSLRANTEFDLTDWLTVGENLNASFADIEETTSASAAEGLLSEAYRYPPYAPVKNPEQGNTDNFGYVTSATDLNSAANPVAKVAMNDDKRDRGQLMGSLYGNVDITEGLTFKTKLSVNLTGEYNYNYRRKFQNGNMIRESQLSEDYDWNLNPLIENTLTYNKELGNHNINLLVGNTYDYSRGRHLGIQGRFFPNDEIRLIKVAGEQNILNNAVTARANALLSYFGRVNYNFKNKYLLTFNFRRDGSAKFGPENKWGNFPSFSVGWKMHEEDFIQNNVSSISQLKLRGGWGKSGNDLIGSYQYASNIHQENLVYVLGESQQVVNGATISSLSNPNIRWEETSTLDLGIDLGLQENRYVATINYFDKQTSGILLDVPIPPSLGYGLAYSTGAPTVNEADVRNSGLEFDLGYRHMEGQFQYRIDANASVFLVKGKVQSLGQGEPIFAGGGQLLDNMTKTAEGITIGSFYGYRVDKVYSTQEEIDKDNQMAQETTGDPNAAYEPNASPGDFRFKDLNGDGQITTEDREVIGNPIPDFTYGLSGWIKYRNFDASLTIQGVQGNDIFNSELYWEIAQERPWNATTRVLDRWQEPGDKTDWPRAASGDPNNNSRPSDKYVDDGSYMRLRNLSLGYNFNNVAGFSKLRLHLTMKNLVTLTDYGWYDPEIGGSNLTRGIDNGVIPQPRTFLMGVEVNF
jgi:TonB-linked SusC/RagA family outer membrane protein